MANDDAIYNAPVVGTDVCGIGVRTIRADLIDAQANISKEQGRRTGVVISLVNVPPGMQTPAQMAGLENGDRITHYRYSTEEEWRPIPKTRDESVLRGAQGSPIMLRLIRSRTGEPYEVTLMRDAYIETPDTYYPGMELRFMPDEESKCVDLSQGPLPTPSVPKLASGGRGMPAG